MPANHRLVSATVAVVVLTAGIVTGAASSGAASTPSGSGATAQASATGTPAPYDRGTVIDIPRDAPATVEVTRVFRRGTVFSVAVYENASTGYLWSSSLSDGPAVVFLDTDLVPDNVPPGTVGAGGTRYFRYRADHSGRSVITLLYQRSWEPAPIRSVTLTVVVR